MKYSIVTFGCRVNQADSLRIEEDLRARGGVAVPSSDADLVVVNTCSVTRAPIRARARPSGGSLATIRSAEVVVTGCYATRRPEEVAALPERRSRGRATTRKTRARCTTTAERFGDGDGACGAAIEPGVAGRTAFTLRVQTGCEERCSLLHHPDDARRRPEPAGRPTSFAKSSASRRQASRRSRSPAFTWARTAATWRRRARLSRCCARSTSSPADVTFRISSLEPMDCTPEIVDLVAASRGRFAPHFHLPLQHASDRMLALMRRPYTLDYYRRLVDSIVGATSARLDRHRHDRRVSGRDRRRFPREPRLPAGVAAVARPRLPVFGSSRHRCRRHAGKGPGAIVRERGTRLRAIGADLARRFRESQIGTVRPGLTIEDGTLVVTDNYLKVRIPRGIDAKPPRRREVEP